ncbi:MAG: adenine deaminase [Bacteroidetes bacterium]|nr:adenine deaminase [Bacteroidota bacterium]
MNVRIKSNVVDILAEKIYPAEIIVEHGNIVSIQPLSKDILPGSSDYPSNYILPGFIDAHVHVESSMLIPSEFARLAVTHGTIATVSDPHEIANVCGIDGVEFMIENSKTVPFHFNFGAPSCVPATTFETAGAILDAAAISSLLKRKEIKYLSEMMNFPGVLNNDPDVMKKIAAAKLEGKPIDGHAPGLRGETAKKYIDAGITTDHECFTKEEALDKLKYGMKIIIREGSAAKNFEALIELLNDYPDKIMFCSDDKHPDSLVAGHINQLCARAVAKGINVFKVLKAACINPVFHYQLNVGLLRKNDPADFIIVKDLKNFESINTYIKGQLVAENGKSLINTAATANKKTNQPDRRINNFDCSKKNPADFIYSTSFEKEVTISVIEALDGQLITNKFITQLKISDGQIKSDPEKDILKIVVVNRYRNAPVAKAFIKNFGLKKGAIASSVAHDSHNIVAVGVSDESICEAVNLIIEKKGGVSCVDDENRIILALPVAGLMSDEDGYKVASAYTAIDAMAKKSGSTLSAPFMTLSFMALLVIPHLKLSDLGLFDGDVFGLFEKSIS